jgi:hypothetical protein
VDHTKTLLPPIADFLRDVETHASGVGKVLRVPEAALDRSVASVDGAYKALLKLPHKKRMTAEVFTPLTAYVGEVMRLACGGTWTTSAAPGHENEPMIRARDGALLQPFALVLIEVMEHGARGSLGSAVEGVVARYRRAA